MPEYALLINAQVDGQDVPAEEMAAHERYGDQVAGLGARLVSGSALTPSSSARTVRGTQVTDGPFAEAKEVVAGFCVIEARDLDHAVQLARLNPATWRGSVEVRPVLG